MLLTEVEQKGKAALPDNAIEKFLRPLSVAIRRCLCQILRADPAGGRAVLEHLRAYGYDGSIWPVHPTADEIDGYRAYRSLLTLPGVPDCVVVAVSSENVLAVLEQAGQAGVRQVLMLTGGFGELGPEGLALQRAAVELARRHGIRMVGPNSTGLVNVRDKVALSMTSVLTAGAPLLEGGMAIVAQSGAIASSLVERARMHGIGISHLVSVGNQADIDAGEFLRYLAHRREVAVAALYVESIPNRASFEAGVAQMKSNGKPVIALLAGGSPTGEAAASSHTGKVAGRGVLERSLLRALGVTLAEDLDDLWRLGDLLGRLVPFGAL